MHNIQDLRWHLSNTYRFLLEKGEMSLQINDSAVEPPQLPRSSAFDDISIDLRTPSGRRVRGWVGRLDRDAVVGPSSRRRIQGGMRCLYQGRLVREGEYFGHAGDTKGSLASLIGEVEVGFVQPNIMKTDLDRSSAEWIEVEKVMHQFLAPIVREFLKASEKRAVTREEKRTLSSVCDELAETLRRLEEDRSLANSPNTANALADRGEFNVEPPVLGYGGQQRPQAAPIKDSAPAKGQKRQSGVKEPSLVPQPEDAVGRMIRLLAKVSGGGLRPPAILDAFDPSMRSGWRTNGETKLVVNTAFPLYQEFGPAPGYLAETVVMELAKPLEGQEKTLANYIAEVNQITSAWARVHQATA